jgi:hypothetical protein
LPGHFEKPAVLGDQGVDVVVVQSEDVDDVVQQAVDGLAVAFERENPVRALREIGVAQER